ncbi:MAG: glutamate 5-kinase [Muribaculaceae bacterium]|nr:glutamate 5-kinase [Muribaculaceae bacterium]MDE6298871.1 glutamate 5-kinase [Muribaculaceae bacterium]
MNTIVVKIGSNVITRPDGTLDVTRMSALVDQVAALHKGGFRIILVSSGAVAAGRNEVTPSFRLDTVSARQLYSAVGQAKLINRYYELFRDHGLTCGQILTTKEGFGSRTHYLNQKHCMEVMLAQGVIPIINENDTISVTELMFTDNDELSGLVAAMMDADRLIILSNIDGIYDGNPSDPQSSVIREIPPGVTDLSDVVVAGKSTFGRGGMLTKSRIALKVASEGIEVIIANGKRDNVLNDVLTDPSALCTRILPGERVNGVKKWIAHSHDFVKGTLTVNAGAAESLLDPERASSLLPIGVTSVEGNFEKGDLVEIVASDGSHIGVGCSEYPAESLREAIGCKGRRPAVHYDYLYIE